MDSRLNPSALKWMHFDNRGLFVETLFEGAQTVGYYSKGLASSVYFLYFEGMYEIISCKLLLLK